MFSLPSHEGSRCLAAIQCLQKSLNEPQIEGEEFKLEAGLTLESFPEHGYVRVKRILKKRKFQHDEDGGVPQCSPASRPRVPF